MRPTGSRSLPVPCLPDGDFKCSQQICSRNRTERGCLTLLTVYLLSAYRVLLSVLSFEETMMWIKIALVLLLILPLMKLCSSSTYVVIYTLTRRSASSFYRPYWHFLNRWVQKPLSNVGPEGHILNRKKFLLVLLSLEWNLTQKIPNASK